MRFPITDLMDEIKCYNYLLNMLNKDGLKYPSLSPPPFPKSMDSTNGNN